ncbi:MAG TPA: hypothetical protein DCE41_08000 [Cytophagales bacterium]|nr:hypothetical protein [Cytophagales bacterium]HAA24138.1 hypothetical protein [Cytophagales bacterium]HAP63473.1 hypothetical protein [Cytophagales bacterium]
MKKRILIFEDNLISSFALEMMLRENGYHPVGAYDTADQLVMICQETEPDLVVLDIMLNGKKTGVEAASELRYHSTVPILFATAFSQDDVLKDLKTIAGSSLVTKPYDEQRIIKKISEVLAASKKETT